MNLQRIFDPSRIVLSGGIAGVYLEPLRQHMLTTMWALHPKAQCPVVLVKNPHSGILGAAAAVLDDSIRSVQC